MEYIIQLHTGPFEQANLSAREARRKTEKLLKRIPAKAVIFGWTYSRELNNSLLAAAKGADVKTFFWLPVFSEMAFPDHFIRMGAQVRDVGHGSESFEFGCISSAKNLRQSRRVFDEVCSGLSVDGVFLDRIRYPSPAGGLDSFKGCLCERCRSIYRRFGVSMNWLENLSQSEAEKAFTPVSAEMFRYRFHNDNAQRLMAAKRHIVTARVTSLIRDLRSGGCQVGLDLFDPALADFVGQDIQKLSEEADFVKPMLYRVTNAPAGLPFELNALRSELGEAVYNAVAAINGNPLDAASCISRMKAMNGCGQVYPGIEINRMESVCQSNSDSIGNGLRIVEAAGCPGAVLSWNLFAAPQDNIEALLP